MSGFLRELNMEREEVPADFDFGDIDSVEELNTLLRYCQVYSCAVPIDIEDTDTPPMNILKSVQDAQKRIANMPLRELERKATAGDWEMMTELGLRKYVGLGTPLDEKAANELWSNVLKSAAPRGKRLTQKEKAIAATAACYNADYYLERFNREEIPHTSDITNAALCADCAATLECTAPSVLHVGQRYKQILSHADEIVDPDALQEFKFMATRVDMLWRLVERRGKAMDAARRKREAKERRKPNAYQCANDGCPVRATSQMGLKQCAGPCPEEYKPSYCSKECQRKDWKIHKTECRPPEKTLDVPPPPDNKNGSVLQDDDDDSAAELSTLNSKTKKNRKKSLQKKQKKKELKLRMTGSGIIDGMEVTSHTMGAEEMKEFHAAVAERDAWEARQENASITSFME